MQQNTILSCEWSLVLIWLIDTSHTLLLGKLVLDTFSDMSHLDNAKASFGSMSNPLQFWKGSFNIYMVIFFLFFDHLLTFEWTLFIINVDKKGHFWTTYLPPLSCSRSFWKTPYVHFKMEILVTKQEKRNSFKLG